MLFLSLHPYNPERGGVDEPERMREAARAREATPGAYSDHPEGHWSTRRGKQPGGTAGATPGSGGLLQFDDLAVGSGPPTTDGGRGASHRRSSGGQGGKVLIIRMVIMA